MSTDDRPHSLERYRSVFRPGLFAGRCIVVTGGGSGLGRCTVHELASLGARLAIVGRQMAKLDAVAAEIAAIYPEAVLTRHACDVRDEAAVQATVAEVLATHGRIDGLFNCAGGQYPSALRDITLKGWDAVVRNNLHGTFFSRARCYRQWMEATAAASSTCWPTSGAVCRASFRRGARGVLTFTETAACEWGHAGVRVNAVAPG